MANEGLAKLFFELASETRLSILEHLQKENLKMQEIARCLDMTATEAFRQLERLREASLVQRLPDGAFTISQFGKLVLQASSSLNVISKNKDYLSKHDLIQLPARFVDRLGELSRATLTTNVVESLNKGQRIFLEAEEYGWGMAEGVVPEQMESMMTQRISKGFKIKVIIPESLILSQSSPAEIARNMEVRSLPSLPAIIALTEKEAAVTFPFVEGRMDYIGFTGKDLAFHGWAKDLFLYFWERAKRA